MLHVSVIKMKSMIRMMTPSCRRRGASGQRRGRTSSGASGPSPRTAAVLDPGFRIQSNLSVSDSKCIILDSGFTIGLKIHFFGFRVQSV